MKLGEVRNLDCGMRNKENPNHSPFPIPHSPFPILLVDTIGELGAWWGTATIGFVGGSLFSSRGGQNMIEPAAYGVATCFGPNTQNFRDVVELLLNNGAAVRVNSGEELTTFVRRCLCNRSTQPILAAMPRQLLLPNRVLRCVPGYFWNLTCPATRRPIRPLRVDLPRELPDLRLPEDEECAISGLRPSESAAAEPTSDLPAADRFSLSLPAPQREDSRTGPEIPCGER